MQCRDAILQVGIGDKLRMFAGNEEDIAKALVPQRPRFAKHIINAEGDAEDGIVARESTILAVVDALVRKVKRSKQADDFAESLAGQRLRPAAHGFQEFAAG